MTCSDWSGSVCFQTRVHILAMTTTELTGRRTSRGISPTSTTAVTRRHLQQDEQEADQAASAFRDTYYGKVAELSAAELRRGDRGATADRR